METLFALDDPEKIYLHIGAPDDSLLPTDLLKSSILFDQQTDLLNALQYGATQGAHSVRVELAKFLTREYNEFVDPDNLLITSGASQSFFNIIPIFTDSDTVFLMENPTYFLAWEVLKDHGIDSSRIVGISSDDQGLDVEKLQEFLSRDQVSDSKLSKKKFKYLLYLVPTFSNPTGSTLSLERRLKLLELARQYDILVVCDDVYHFLYFEDQLPPARMVSLSRSNVISNCSFSKIFSPGFRLGWIETCPDLLDQLKRSGILNSGGCSNQLTSFLVKSILSKSENHLKKLRREYENRKNLLLKELLKLPSHFKISEPRGGFFIWIQDTSKALNSSELVKKSRTSFTPGNMFSFNNSHGHCIRVSFGHYKEDLLVKGARNLVEILKSQ
jgi:DNA-binding transcriptional MocR family regulator